MKYRFIPTDKVSELSDAERDMASIHKDDHDPEDHICGGCIHPEKDECWADRHGEDVPETRDARLMSEMDERDCQCACHYLVAQCRFTQTAIRNDGRPIYKLETEHDGWSMQMPAAVYDKFMEIPEGERDEAIISVINQAKMLQGAAAQRKQEEEEG